MRIFATLFCLIALVSTSIGQKDFVDFYIGMPEAEARSLVKSLKSSKDIPPRDGAHWEVETADPRRSGERIDFEGCEYYASLGFENGFVASIEFKLIGGEGERLTSCTGDVLAMRWLNKIQVKHGLPKTIFHDRIIAHKWDSETYAALLIRKGRGMSIRFVAPITEQELRGQLGLTKAERIKKEEEDARKMGSLNEGMTQDQVRAKCGEPAMSMTIMDETIWTYGVWMVTFMDGKLIAIDNALDEE